MNGKRVDLRFGSFACSLQGFDDPSEPLAALLRLVQERLEEPALPDGAPLFDAATLERIAAEIGTPGADRMMAATPGLVLTLRPAVEAEVPADGGQAAMAGTAAAFDRLAERLDPGADVLGQTEEPTGTGAEDAAPEGSEEVASGSEEDAAPEVSEDAAAEGEEDAASESGEEIAAKGEADAASDGVDEVAPEGEDERAEADAALAAAAPAEDDAPGAVDAAPAVGEGEPAPPEDPGDDGGTDTVFFEDQATAAAPTGTAGVASIFADPDEPQAAEAPDSDPPETGAAEEPEEPECPQVAASGDPDEADAAADRDEPDATEDQDQPNAAASPDQDAADTDEPAEPDELPPDEPAEPAEDPAPETEEEERGRVVNIFGDPDEPAPAEGLAEDPIPIEQLGAQPVEPEEPSGEDEAEAGVSNIFDAPGDEHSDENVTPLKGRVSEFRRFLRSRNQAEPEEEPLREVALDDVVKSSGAAGVPDLIAASAAWLDLARGHHSFTRKEVIAVFDGISGEHPKSLEAKIKGFGRLVRNGQLLSAGDDRFKLSDAERERYGRLID